MKKITIQIIALLLVILGVALCYYKHVRLGVPLSPHEREDVWTAEARIHFRADSGPTQVHFVLPDNPPGFAVLDEVFVSRDYGLNLTEENGIRRADWAVRRSKGRQSLYYRIQLAEDVHAGAQRTKPIPLYPEVPDYPEPDRSAIMALLEDVRNESADIQSFTHQLLKRYNRENPDENVVLLRNSVDNPTEKVEQLISILAGRRIPARLVHVLELSDGLKGGKLQPWLEVYNEEYWIAFNPHTGKRGYPSHVLPWHFGSAKLVSIEGGGGENVEFSVSKRSLPSESVAGKREQFMGGSVLQFSLLGLPVKTQNVYRILLMVPLGAMVVVFLRTFVGISTFGTFMPILVALAFRETQLLWGIFLFILLVSLGLLLRLYLERMRLLLVPRLTAVLIIVVMLMILVSIISHRLGSDRALSIALFPMVIIAMTIERMSLVWEERGSAEAMRQGLGTLFTAILGYLVMTNSLLTHLLFAFPELLLVLLGACFFLGRYSGYRLTELWRFRHLVKGQKTPNT